MCTRRPKSHDRLIGIGLSESEWPRIKYRYLVPHYGPKYFEQITLVDLDQIIRLHLEDTLPCSMRSQRGFDVILQTRRDLTEWLHGEDFTQSTLKRITELEGKKSLSADERDWFDEARKAQNEWLIELTRQAMAGTV